MGEQTVILCGLVFALGATLWLYFLRAGKQMKYAGDERWQLIQLKAGNLSGITNWILLFLLIAVPLFVDTQTMITVQRVVLLGEIYFGFHNLLEVFGIYYFDTLSCQGHTRSETAEFRVLLR